MFYLISSNVTEKKKYGTQGVTNPDCSGGFNTINRSKPAKTEWKFVCLYRLEFKFIQAESPKSYLTDLTGTKNRVANTLRQTWKNRAYTEKRIWKLRLCEPSPNLTDARHVPNFHANYIPVSTHHPGLQLQASQSPTAQISCNYHPWHQHSRTPADELKLK